MTHPSHAARYSDSSIYDEVCDHCGANDSMPGRPLDKPCPAQPWHGAVVTNTPRAGETPEQIAARFRDRAPSAAADLITFAKTGGPTLPADKPRGPRLRGLDLGALRPALLDRESRFVEADRCEAR